MLALLTPDDLLCLVVLHVGLILQPHKSRLVSDAALISLAYIGRQMCHQTVSFPRRFHTTSSANSHMFKRCFT